jgi:hypothetical protein
MVPARVVDSLTSALRGRRSTLSYAGTIGGGGDDRTSDPGFTKTLHCRWATPGKKNSQTAETNPAKTFAA